MSIREVVKEVFEILTGRGVQPEKHISWHEHEDGSVRFTFKHTPSLIVTMRPDKQVPYVPGLDDACTDFVRSPSHYLHEAGRITTVTPPSLTLTRLFELPPPDKDFVGPPAPPVPPWNGENGKGRGYTLGDHENSHIADYLQGIIQVPPPDHQWLVGQPEKQWETYQQDWQQWHNNLLQCSDHITDRVPLGFTSGDPGLRDLNEACNFLMRPHSGTSGFSGPSGMPRR